VLAVAVDFGKTLLSLQRIDGLFLMSHFSRVDALEDEGDVCFVNNEGVLGVAGLHFDCYLQFTCYMLG